MQRGNKRLKGTIAHYTIGVSPFRGGGLVKYVEDLAEQESLTEDVCIIYPGRFFGSKHRTKIVRNEYRNSNISCFEIINSNPVSFNGIAEPRRFMDYGDVDLYRKWLIERNICIIHLHTVMGLHPAFIEAAKGLGIKILFTVHDYFPICPIITMHRRGALCECKSGANCKECCQNGSSVKWLIFLSIVKPIIPLLLRLQKRLLVLIKGSSVNIDKKVHDISEENNAKAASLTDSSKNDEYGQLSKFYIDMLSKVDIIMYNSRQTMNIYSKYCDFADSIVLHLAHKDISDKRKIRKSESIVRIGFLSAIENPKKGGGFLLDVLRDLWKENKNFSLNIYTNDIIESEEFIEQHGRYSYDEMDTVMNNLDVVVVPSLWKETFGFVAIEAISRGIPVVMTDNVASKEWCKNYNGIVRVVSPNKESMYNCIKELLDNTELIDEMNRNICNSNMKFSFSDHTKEVLVKYMELVDDDNMYT